MSRSTRHVTFAHRSPRPGHLGDSAAAAARRCAVLGLALTGLTSAQTPQPATGPTPAAPAPQTPSDDGSPWRRKLDKLQGISLRYPRDKDRAVASVDGRQISLEELVRHMEERHAPGFAAFLATPAGNLFFNERQPSDWVRHFADVVALRAAARAQEVQPAVIEAAQQRIAETGFNIWLQEYVADQQKAGAPTEVSDARRANLLARYRRDFGLALERQALLNVLSPDFEQVGLDAAHHFHREYPRYFGGLVHMAHILIYTRHPVTSQLLAEADARRAQELIAEVQARLKPDGSNFEEVARLFSEDRRTGERGGVLRNVSRFDSRLPPSITREAWDMIDGEWRGPIESPFGVHFVKRLSYTHHSFFLVTERSLPHVRDTMSKKIQEDIMIDVRKRHRVTLLY